MVGLVASSSDVLGVVAGLVVGDTSVSYKKRWLEPVD